MKKLSVACAVVLALGIALGPVSAWAEDEQPAAEQKAPKLSEMDGKELFKMVCKHCHGAEAEAGEYTPMSLIVEQWEEFFDGGFTETHKKVVCPSDAEKCVTDVLDKDMLKKIKKFCVDHAADSEQPMTCG